jgi:phosphatidylglycerophosphate synthase
MAPSRVVTLPNVISSSRVALAVGFLAADAVPVRLALIVVAAITDVLDGWLARRFQVASRIGALIDPVADRLFVLGVVIGYVLGGELRLWQAVVLLFRDVMSVIGFFVARSVRWLRPIPFKARWLGKAVTVAQTFTFLAVLLMPGWVTPLLLVVALLGVAATVDYTLMLWRERVPVPPVSPAG